MRFPSGSAAVVGALALPAAIAIEAGVGQRLGSPAFAVAGEGQQAEVRRKLPIFGLPISSTQDFPGTAVLGTTFPHRFGAIVGTDRIVVVIQPFDRIEADTEVFPLEKSEPDFNDQPFTRTVGTARISGGATVVFTEDSLTSLGLANVGTPPLENDQVTILGFNIGTPVQAAATVVSCGLNSGANKFCFTAQGTVVSFVSGETAAVFRDDEFVGLLDTNTAPFLLDGEQTFVARSIESLLPEIESAEVVDNFPVAGPEEEILRALLPLGGLALIYAACLFCVCAVASKRNAQQLAELQKGNLNSPEAIAARVAATRNGLPQLQPASQRQQMFVMPPGAPPPAGMVAVAYIMPDEPVIATAMPVSGYKF